MVTNVPGTPYLVLGDDLSPGADLAWAWVQSQRWPGWTLVDVRADPPSIGRHVDPADISAHPDSGPPPRPTHADAGFVEVRFLVADADPRLALSDWPGAAVVVVGEAASGVGPRLVGSTTEWLIHDPTTPVLLARRGRPVRRALVCADGSAHASAAAAALVGLPWAGDVAVEVLAIDDGRADAGAAVDALVDVLGDRTASVTPTVEEGRSPHRRILAAANSRDVDLVVLGSHGLSTLRRLTLGSTASAVARLATASVLVARAGSTSP